MKRRDLLLLVLSLALTVFGAVQLIGHFSAREAGRQAEQELRDMYYAAADTAIPTLPPRQTTAEPETAEPTGTPAPTPDATVKAEVQAPRITRLRGILYPDNPGLVVNSRFRELRKENRDIIGWLTVGKMIDEAVVQRDNEYYMDHDIAGRQNAGGTVFLDQSVSLRTRPYALILYGHNMRDQSRFGWLRKYEDEAFYRKNRIISFNTLYENGRYVVFSEGTVSTEEEDANYLDFFGLDSTRTDERARALGVLQDVSVLDSDVDVRIDDQILVLVTCVDRDTDRRIVAARRIRDGEDETAFLN